MGAEMLESQSPEVFAASWPSAQHPSPHKRAVIDLEDVEQQSDTASEASDELEPTDEVPQRSLPAEECMASDVASEPEVPQRNLPAEECRASDLLDVASEPEVTPETEQQRLESARQPCAAEEETSKASPSSVKDGPAVQAQDKAKGPKRKVLFNASHSDYEVVAAAAEARGWRVVKQEERASFCNVHWIDDANIGDWLRRVEPWMRVNHFPGMNNALARKSRLARNMSRMMRSFPEYYPFIPPTWVLPDDLTDLTKRFDSSGETKAIYIVKPDHLCQGRGIFLTTDLERIKKVSAESREKDQAVVVQRYITRPMLIEGLKFDLRLYLLVTGVLGEGGLLEPRYFLFRDGLVRFCTTPYEPPTPETFEKRGMHLTNYAINKNSKAFKQSTSADDGSGSKRSLRWFLSYVEQEFGEKERRKLWQKMMGLCTKTLLTVHSTLEAEYDGVFPKDLTGGQMGCRCFEVLGVDVMLDWKRKPYLIEVNHLPSFTCDSPLDEDIKQRLINQVMDLTCSSISTKDKRVYDQLVRDRREAATTSGTGTTADQQPAQQMPVQAKSKLDQTEYKDFERAYPPPASAPKLAAQCEAILSRVREIFRPVHLVPRRTRSTPEGAENNQTVAGSRPPLPPRPPPAPASAPARPPSHCEAAASCTSAKPRPPSASQRRAASSVPSAESDPAGRGPPTRKKRSRSAPGPPRCALPPIARFSSPRLARHLTATPEPAEPEAATPARQGSMVRVPSRQRVFLPLKSAQILL